MNSPPVIELDRVGYRQQETQILSDINWSLRTGEHWAVLGPNGSGKTTLLKIACGYLWPSTGRVLRLGQELCDLRELRRHIGWITSDLAGQIPAEESALETVVTGRLDQWGLKHFLGFEPTEQDFADARAMLVGLRCESLIEKPFGVLSQGERQQVLIARARMSNPLLLVLDEPCAGMDPGVRERFLAWLDEAIAVTAESRRGARDASCRRDHAGHRKHTHADGRTHSRGWRHAHDRHPSSYRGSLRAASPCARILWRAVVADLGGPLLTFVKYIAPSSTSKTLAGSGTADACDNAANCEYWRIQSSRSRPSVSPSRSTSPLAACPYAACQMARSAPLTAPSKFKSPPRKLPFCFQGVANNSASVMTSSSPRIACKAAGVKASTNVPFHGEK